MAHNQKALYDNFVQLEYPYGKSNILIRLEVVPFSMYTLLFIFVKFSSTLLILKYFIFENPNL